MPVTPPIETNFLYRFEAGSQVFTYTNISDNQVYNDELYVYAQIEHTQPTFSSEPQDAELDVNVFESIGLADVFINGPPAYQVVLMIYEYDRATDTATAYYRGWVVRAANRLTTSLIEFHAKSVWHYFDRESISDSLSSLSRYNIYDPRSGVDMEALRVGVTVTALNDERDMLTVTGLTDIDGWYQGGIIRAPDSDRRTIVQDITESGNRHLYLNGAFPLFTLAAGFSADVFPGDDLTYDTWANKFSTESDHGEAWGGWQYTPNVDPAVRGVT